VRRTWDDLALRLETGNALIMTAAVAPSKPAMTTGRRDSVHPPEHRSRRPKGSPRSRRSVSRRPQGSPHSRKSLSRRP